MFCLGPNTRLELFGLVGQGVSFCFPCSALCACLGIHANVSLHAEIPLVAFLAGVHLKVTLFIFVLGGCECGNQGGVYGCARLEQQSASGQEFIDKAVDLLDQFVFLQSVSKSRNGGLIGQATKLFQLGKLPLQRNVKEGFFHRRVS